MDRQISIKAALKSLLHKLLCLIKVFQRDSDALMLLQSTFLLTTLTILTKKIFLNLEYFLF